MYMKEKDIQTQAEQFARKERKKIAQEVTDLEMYPAQERPVSVFMAGSPGAGKTEFSKYVIEYFEKTIGQKFVRIDGDDLRVRFPGYTGDNSSLFQFPVTLIVEKIHDTVLSQKQSFVLDGTLSKYEKAVKNIQTSLEKRRLVVIFYIYQHPITAWKFTQKRELVEGRNIPKKAFIEQFLGAKETVGRIRKEFNDDVTVFLVKKDYEKNTVEGFIEIKSAGQSVDDCIKERYTKKDLEDML